MRGTDQSVSQYHERHTDHERHVRRWSDAIGEAATTRPVLFSATPPQHPVLTPCSQQPASSSSGVQQQQQQQAAQRDHNSRRQTSRHAQSWPA